MPLAAFEHLSLSPDGPTVSMTLSAGHFLGVTGPAGSGKSRLMRIFAGMESAPRGKIRCAAPPVLAGSEKLSRRSKPQTLISKRAEAGYATLATEVLSALQLWDVRQDSLADLTPSQIAACEMIELFSSNSKVLLIDGQLDRLDPLAFHGAFDLLCKRAREGAAVAIATNQADKIGLCDAAIVLKKNVVRFAGTISDLLRLGPRHEIRVITQYAPGTRALVAPYEILIEETPDGLRMEAAEGQAIAAKLLRDGYGDIQATIVQPPTPEEAVLALLRT